MSSDASARWRRGSVQQSRKLPPAETACEREYIDRAESKISGRRNPIQPVQRPVQSVYPVAATDRHYAEARHAGCKGPRHSPGTLAREVKRHACPEQRIERRRSREVCGSVFDNLSIAAAEQEPCVGKGRGGKSDGRSNQSLEQSPHPCDFRGAPCLACAHV